MVFLGIIFALVNLFATDVDAAAPCCGITAIDARNGLVTAKVNQTGQIFQFQVGNPVLLRSLKVGQEVYANLSIKQVSLDGKSFCCAIVKLNPVLGGRMSNSPAPQTNVSGSVQSSQQQAETTSVTGTSSVASPVKKATPTRGSGTLPAVDMSKVTASEGSTAMATRGKPAPPAERVPGRLGVFSPASENANGQADPPPRVSTIPRLGPGIGSSSRPMLVKDHPQAQQILSAIGQALAQREINVALLGGQKYMINDCLGIKASAGQFYLRVSNPTVGFDGAAIKIEAAIEHISLNVLKVRVRPNLGNLLEPCKFSGAFEVGGAASNVRFEMRLGGPTLDLNQCRVATLGPVDVRWHVGGLNLKPLQNNLDEVAKEMIEDALNASTSFLMDPVSVVLEGFLDTVCETKVALYRRYMDQLGAGVTLYHLPAAYVAQLRDYYPKVRLETVRFGFSNRQPPNNATTDCHNTYFGSREYVDKLRTSTVGNDVYWLYHELRHTEQCNELGGRDFYAERWFRDLEISALSTNLNNPDYYRVLHDRMPMERDADGRGKVVMGKLPALASELASVPATKNVPK